MHNAPKNERLFTLILKRTWLWTHLQFFKKTKERSYGEETTDFRTRKIPEAGSFYICWSVILTDSVLKKDEIYYPQVFLKEFKYIEKEKSGD